MDYKMRGGISVLILLAPLVIACAGCGNEQVETQGVTESSFIGAITEPKATKTQDITFDNGNLVTAHLPILRATVPLDVRVKDVRLEYGNVTAVVYLGANEGESQMRADKMLAAFDKGLFEDPKAKPVKAGQWKGFVVTSLTAKNGGADYWLFSPHEHLHLRVTWSERKDATNALVLTQWLLHTVRQTSK